MTNQTMNADLRPFAVDVDEVMQELPRLLSGETQAFEVRTTDDRVVIFGRFRMRTLDGKPQYYMMLADTKRGQVVDTDYLVNMLAVLRKHRATETRPVLH